MCVFFFFFWGGGVLMQIAISGASILGKDLSHLLFFLSFPGVSMGLSGCGLGSGA